MTVPRRAAQIAAAVVTALALAACTPSVEQVAPSVDAPWPGGDVLPTAGVTPQDSRVYEQAISWRSCGSLECADLLVPLDWSNPNGPTITIAINRSPARVPDEKLGSLLINPGGPGGSGLELTTYFLDFAGDDLLDHYDIIGFDPRGVGASSPISCGTAEELNAYFLDDATVETQEDLDAARQKNVDFATRCRELTGPLIENVDTASVARDMDVARAVLGDEKLNYLGFSYGTQLGATYAALHPENVGRLVLDGAVDFLLTPQELSLGQAAGFESALEAYINDCIAGPDCPLPPNVDDAKRAILDVALEARDHGIPTGEEDLTGSLAVYGIVVVLYDNANWKYLTEALREVIDRGTGRTLLDLANFYLDRDSAGEYASNGTEAFTVISCLDEPDEPPATIVEHREFRRLAEEASPTFGWWFANGAGCDGWPYTAHEVVQDLSAAAGIPPILVLGTTGDPATPFVWAQALADEFPSAVMVAYDGEGHTAYGRSNQCVIDVVDAYFVDGVVPDSGKTC